MLQDILKKFESLPEEKKRFLSSPMALASLEEIEKKYGVKLALILMEVAIDESKKNNLASFLENRLALPKDTSFQLARDLEEDIFQEFEEAQDERKNEEPASNPVFEGPEINSSKSVIKENAPNNFGAIGNNFNRETILPKETKEEDKKDGILFGEDDDREIKEIKVNNIKPTGGLVVDWDNEAGEIINKLNIEIKNEILKNRLKNIIVSTLKGVRNSISAKETLMRRVQEGGMELDGNRVENIIREIKAKKEKIEAGLSEPKKKEPGFEFVLGRENEPMIKKEKDGGEAGESGDYVKPEFINREPLSDSKKETTNQEPMRLVSDNFNEKPAEEFALSGDKSVRKEFSSFMDGEKKPFNIFGNKKSKDASAGNGSNILAPPPPAIFGGNVNKKNNESVREEPETSGSESSFAEAESFHKIKTNKPLFIEEEKPVEKKEEISLNKSSEIQETKPVGGRSEAIFKNGVLQSQSPEEKIIKKEDEKQIIANQKPAIDNSISRPPLMGDSFDKKLEEIKKNSPAGQINNFSFKPKQEEVKKENSFTNFIFNKKNKKEEVKKYSGGKVKMEDVKKVKIPDNFNRDNEDAKLVGPIEELKIMTVDYFRELSSDPFRAAEKIEEKINNLEEMSLENKVAGIKAWKTGEVSRMYMQILNTALIEHKSFSQIIAEKREKRETVLTEEEFEAVAELNKRLRF